MATMKEMAEIRGTNLMDGAMEEENLSAAQLRKSLGFPSCAGCVRAFSDEFCESERERERDYGECDDRKAKPFVPVTQSQLVRPSVSVRPSVRSSHVRQ